MKCCARRLCTAASELVSGVGRGYAHGACRAGSAGAGVAGRESVGATPSGSASGGCAFRRDLWGYACAMVGGRTMAGGRAVWFLEKTRRHMGRKSRDLDGKRCQPFAALACGVGDKVAGRCDVGGGSAGRIKRHVYRQGGVMIFFRFSCIPFGPCGLFRLACSCKRHARRLLLMETAARMALQFVCSRDFMPRALRIRKGRAGAVSAP